MLTGKHEVVHSYGWYLRRFVADARAKGATPIICSLVPRKIWDERGMIRRNTNDYAGWAAAGSSFTCIGGGMGTFLAAASTESDGGTPR